MILSTHLGAFDASLRVNNSQRKNKASLNDGPRGAVDDYTQELYPRAEGQVEPLDGEAQIGLKVSICRR